MTITVITLRRVNESQSIALPKHERVVYRLSLLLHSVGHRVKTHRITPAVGNELGDIEIKDDLILPHGEDDRLPKRSTHTQSVLYRCSSS
jgi:hypothetical protein